MEESEPMMPTTDQLLTVDEVMERLNVSRMTIHRMMRRGTLKAVPDNPLYRKPRKLFFREADVKALLNRPA